jgi:predicted DNA-binding transcriptional regulator AlpA
MINYVQGRAIMTNFNEVQHTVGFYRLKSIIGDPKAKPPVEPIIPISKSSWYQGIADNKYPKPVRIGVNMSAWRRSDIEELCTHLEKGGK